MGLFANLREAGQLVSKNALGKYGVTSLEPGEVGVFVALSSFTKDDKEEKDDNGNPKKVPYLRMEVVEPDTYEVVYMNVAGIDPDVQDALEAGAKVKFTVLDQRLSAGNSAFQAVLNLDTFVIPKQERAAPTGRRTRAGG